MDSAFHAFIKSMFPEASPQEHEDIYDVFLAEVNETEVLYGAKAKVVDSKFSDEAVLPAFARRICILLGHPSNPATMLRVQILMMDSIGRASLDELVNKAREEK